MAEGRTCAATPGMAFNMLADSRLVVGQEVKISIEGELVEVPAAVGAA